MELGKIGTAMVTPFDDKGNVDLTKTTALVEHLIENGSDSLVIAGTTGESPTLSTDEKLTLFDHVVKVVRGRIPVIAGTGSNNTEASVQLTKKAEAAGVDGIMLVVPYYNKPSQAGMYEHFRTVAKNTSLPVLLYNIPGRSVVNMAVDTVIQLAQIPNITAIKEASGDLSTITEIITSTPATFKVYSGDDSLTLPVLAVGGAGVISVASHIIGNEMQDMVTSYQSGDVAKAALLHQRLLPVMQSLFMTANPAPLKTALQIRGIDTGSVRLPLVPLNQDETAVLMKAIDVMSI